MIGASDHDLQAATLARSAEYRAEVRCHPSALGIGLSPVVAHQEHHWLSETLAHDAAPGRSV